MWFSKGKTVLIFFVHINQDNWLKPWGWLSLPTVGPLHPFWRPLTLRLHLGGASSNPLLGASSPLPSEACFQFVNQNSNPRSGNSSEKGWVWVQVGFPGTFLDKVLRPLPSLPTWSTEPRRASDVSHAGILLLGVVFFSPISHSGAQWVLHCLKAKFCVFLGLYGLFE